MRKAWPLLLLLVLAGAAAVSLLVRDRGGGPVAGGPGDDAGTDGRPAPSLAGTPTAEPRPGRTPTAPAPEGQGPDATAAGPEEGPTISGTVIDDETGKPVAGATVLAQAAAEPCPRAPDDALFLPPTSEPVTGRVRVRVEGKDAPVQIAMVPRSEGGSGADGSFALPWGRGRGPADLAVRRAGYVIATACRVEPGQPVTVRLGRGLSIEGVVVRDDGTPVPGATLSARPAPGTPALPGHMEVATADADGRFRIAGLLAGPVVVTADHPKFVPTTLAPMEPGATGVRIVLVPALLLTISITTDDGKEPDSPSAAWRTSGQPPRDGLQLLERAVPHLPDAPVTGPALQPPSGAFRYAPLRVPCDRPDVVFTVKAVGCSPWVSEPIALPHDGGEQTLDVPLSRDPTLGSLRVVLEDRDSHQPLSFAAERCQVQIGRRDGQAVPAGIIIKPGEALELPALPAGPYTLVIRSPAHAPARFDAEVPAARDAEQRVALGPPAKVKVKFTAPEALMVRFRVLLGREVQYPFVENAAVSYNDGESGTDQALAAGADGVVLSGLAAGRHTIEVISPELVAPPTPVDLTEGETRDVEIQVTRR